MTQRLISRVDVTGPTGLDVFGRALDWRTMAGYTRFLGTTGDLLGFQEFLEVGGGLELDVRVALGPLSRLTMSGALLLGQDVDGRSIGIGAGS